LNEIIQNKVITNIESQFKNTLHKLVFSCITIPISTLCLCW